MRVPRLLSLDAGAYLKEGSDRSGPVTIASQSSLLPGPKSLWLRLGLLYPPALYFRFSGNVFKQRSYPRPPLGAASQSSLRHRHGRRAGVPEVTRSERAQGPDCTFGIIFSFPSYSLVTRQYSVEKVQN